MIRLIDLRGQDTGYLFAFWDTVKDRFISVGNDQAWDSIQDFKEGAMIAGIDDNLELRMLGLCPAWVPKVTLSECQHTFPPVKFGTPPRTCIKCGDASP